jgi:hypothetical protein
MNDKLCKLLTDASNLLEECGYHDKSKWFLERMNVLKNENNNSDIFKQTVIEIKSILGGMGSFSDLSMVPSPGAKISAEEARLRQWDLTEEIDDEICALLK